MTTRTSTIVLAILLLVQTFLLGWAGYRHGPGYDEPAHLASGVIHWRLGKYEPYRVNPPLVRMIAAVPLVVSGVDAIQTSFDTRPGARTEFDLGSQMMTAEGLGFLWLLTMGRWACIPLAWTGLIVCYLWANRLYGRSAGLAAAALWTFSPSILAHAQLMTPDAGGAALGLAACYAFACWLERPTWRQTILVGALLAIALLCKSTWIVLFGIWPLLAVWNLCRRWDAAWKGTRKVSLLQFGAVLLIAVVLLNAGYRFTGTFTRLGDYRFVSKSLSGVRTDRDLRRRRRARPGKSGNRFAGSWLGRVPVPLPRDFVQGIDEQKSDFEIDMMSYVGGEMRRGGRWYFYLYAGLVKIPIGTWLLILVAGAVAVAAICKQGLRAEVIPLAVPAIVLLIFVSSQTGINQHARYALPVLPFLLIAASGALRSGNGLGATWRHRIAMVLIVLSAWESLSVYPHSLSFFNLAAGGPSEGYRHLGIQATDSNLDWGLDVTYFKEWVERHPTARPLYADIDSMMPLSVLEIDAGRVEIPPRPGWYAISVGALVRKRRYEVFTEMEPVERFGYTIYVYRVR